MSFSVDQFMQVKCKFTLTSETESSESIYTNNEQVRLCKSVQLDASNNSTLIVMVCSNEVSNNHILAYYIERPQCQTSPAYNEHKVDETHPTSHLQDNSLSMDNDDSTANSHVTFTKLAQLSNIPRHQALTTPSSNISRRKSKTKPRIIVKQIYYHNYNEDIVAISLNQSGTKLVLINASSTIYIIPIKNIILNIHAQQLRASQCGSMYYYDASILNPSKQDQRWSFTEPVDVVCWESEKDLKSTLVVASQSGQLTFINIDDKSEIGSTNVCESIKRLEIIQDGCGRSLLITCMSLNQYRLVLESDSTREEDLVEHAANTKEVFTQANSLLTRLPKSRFSRTKTDLKSPSTQITRKSHLWATKPIPVKPPPCKGTSSRVVASKVIQRVFTPSASNLGVQAGLSLGDDRDRPHTLLGYQPPNLISLIDVLGTKNHHSQSNQHYKLSSNLNLSDQSRFQEKATEPRLLRFYSSKSYSHQAQRPQILCKLDLLDPDELIVDLILTERFVAYTTDRDRCIINSRNCCKLKSSSINQAPRMDSLNPLVKEIAFNHEEKIVLLVKSPISNDQDNIIDSFLLVTTRSIYSIEARHNCRELFINLIDSHLAIRRTLFMSRFQVDCDRSNYGFDAERVDNKNHRAFNLDFHQKTPNSSYDTHRNAESNLLINNFLQHREVYERICHDSQAFSTLFKLELVSLYEAYADRLLQREQFDLANRFFQMASFDHTKILGKYIRVGYFREAIDYVKDALNDENDFRRVMIESEKIEIAKMAFECLLAKTVVERGKTSLFNAKLGSKLELKLLTNLKTLPQNPRITANRQPPDISSNICSNVASAQRYTPFDLCEHSPQGQDAKLSATTIVPQSSEEDEETLTSNTGTNSSALIVSSKMTRANSQRVRLECEKALIDFAKNYMPASMYEYTVDQLLDFNLIDIIDTIAQTDSQILSFLKMVIRYKEDDRLIFRACKLDNLSKRLSQLDETSLTKVNTRNRQFLEFLTSARVNKALVKDISLVCDFYGYQHTLVQFRKYSFAALRQLETLKQLILMREVPDSLNVDQNGNSQPGSELQSLIEQESFIGGDDANDGSCFKLKFNKNSTNARRWLFNEQYKQTAESIFTEFLVACLDESTDDSCRLWSNYINYYLNNIGNLDQLELDILRLIETNGDSRLAISLYKAIYRDEAFASKTKMNNVGDRKAHPNHTQMKGLTHKSNATASSSAIVTHLGESDLKNTSNDIVGKFYNLDNLFKNEFLMRLLEKTLDLLTQSVDLDALNIATMC